MKTLLIILVAGTAFALVGIDLKESEQNVSKTYSRVDSSVVRLDGVYSLYDTSKGNCGVETYKRFIYVSPILFINKKHFIQIPYSGLNDHNMVDSIKSGNIKFDYGKYYFGDNRITLEGTFTFFARGMDWRQYKAKYVGYFDQSGDTLYLKLTEPYPPINLKFNNSLVKRLKDGTYLKYIFKPLIHNEINIDKYFLKE